MQMADIMPRSLDNSWHGSLGPQNDIFSSEHSGNYVAVTGMACQLPGAADMDEFWTLLRSGRSQHKEVPPERFGLDTPWREDDGRRKWYGNFIEDYDKFDERFFRKGPRESMYTDPQNRLMLQVAYQACEQAGCFRSSSRATSGGRGRGKGEKGGEGEDEKEKEKEKDDTSSVGCYIGVGLGDYERNVACHPPTSYTAVGNLRAFVAGSISHQFGWTGPSLTLDTACSSSAVAIHSACRAVLGGDCRAALAGGVNIMTSPDWFQNLAAASFLSPTGQCRPFDAAADGYCRGEAVGAVFLKTLASALADGDVVHGVIAASAVSQSQNSTPITVPHAPSLAGHFEDAIRRSGITPAHISYIEAHGTGTPLGDPIEYQGVRKVFGERGEGFGSLSLGSVKGLIGHSEAASGVVALLKLLLMLHHGCIPPQASFHTLRSDIRSTSGSDGISINTQQQPWMNRFKAALMNNYGASGSNATLVVAQSPQASATSGPQSGGGGRSAKPKAFPVALFALDEEGLRRYSLRLLSFIRSGDHLSAADIAFQLDRQANWSLPCSFIFSFGDMLELREKLEAVTEPSTATTDISSVMGIRIPPSRPVILCFGGQTSKHIGLNRHLYEEVAIFRKHLDCCRTICQSLGEDLYPFIFQTTTTGSGDIVKLQLGLFALQYACARSWIDCGVRVAAVIGHSFGEIPALCISGVLSLNDALTVVTSRARLVRDHWGADKGRMLAVRGDQEVVENLLADSQRRYPEKHAATIACYNGGRSFTISGPKGAIDALLQFASGNSYSSTVDIMPLDVTNAFHCSLVDPLQDPLRTLARGFAFNRPVIPIELATETEKQQQELPDADFFAGQMRRPVYFGRAVHRLSKKFPSAIWLEAGSSSTITTMASRALGGSPDSHFQPVNITAATTAGGLQDLTATTIKLWREGLDVTFWPHHAGQVAQYRPLILPPYQFKRTKHWMELKRPSTQYSHRIEPELPSREALWSLESCTASDMQQRHRSARFRIHTNSKRFKSILDAHRILHDYPLCPSTVQLHIAINALASLHSAHANGVMQPRLLGMDCHVPMTTQNHDRVVWLDATTPTSVTGPGSSVWHWRLASEDASSGLRSLCHVSGTIAFRDPQNDAGFLEELATHAQLDRRDRSRALLGSWDVDEVLQGRSVYRSFSDIVEYGEMFRHVRKLVGKGNESAGRVVMAPTSGNYAAGGDAWFDFALTDCFCQVAGIYLNTIGNRTSDEVFISDQIGQWSHTPRIHLVGEIPEPSEWEVYACHHQLSSREFVCDIFVFDPKDGALLHTFIGVHYKKVAKASLKRSLAKAMDKAGILPPGPITVAGKEGLKDRETMAENNMSKSIALMQATAPSTTASSVRSQLKELLASLSGLDAHEICDDSDLVDSGVDSLMVMELAREIEGMFKCTVRSSDLQGLHDFRSMVTFVEGIMKRPSSCTDSNRNNSSTPSGSNEGFISDNSYPKPTARGGSTRKPITNGHSSQLGTVSLPTDIVLSTFAETKAATDAYVVNRGLGGYIENVLPRLNLACLGYIREAFEQLGVDYSSSSSAGSSRVDYLKERIACLPRHEKFVTLLGHLLESHSSFTDCPERSSVDMQSPGLLLQRLRVDYPAHSHDYDLIELVGGQLAECLAGRADGVQIIFGSAEGRKIVSAMYGQSPINLVWIRQLSDFLKNLVSRGVPIAPPAVDAEGSDTLKILEVGAGTGGTTAQILPILAELGVAVHYTVTDISSSLVAAARKRFKGYDWVGYRVLDLEQPVAADLLGSQHIVLATNCVHVSSHIVDAAARLRRLLRPDDGGFLVMLEMTQTLVWIDLVFGLLEGWWQFDDGRAHALQSAPAWKEALCRAGYDKVDWTGGELPETAIQRLILATASTSSSPPVANVSTSLSNTGVDLGEHASLEAREDIINSYVREFTPPDLSYSPARPPSQQGNGKGVADAPSPPPAVVLITGATGSLGSHLVQHLVGRPEVAAITCLNRSRPHDAEEEASSRQMEAFTSRGITGFEAAGAASKLQVFETDTSRPLLGLSPRDYDYVACSVTHVVHSAWPMSLTRPLRGYEAQFKTMRNLLLLVHDIHKRKPTASITFQFISSIAVVGLDPVRTGEPRVLEEAMPVSSVLPNGYAEAKLVCERLLLRAATPGPHPGNLRPMVVRLGQVAGSRSTGYWNPLEHFPAMVKSAQTLGVLPGLQGVS